MKRKDLEALGLEKEAIDKIMDLNGTDIENARKDLEKVESERDNYKSQYETATKELEGITKNVRTRIAFP